LNITFKTQTAFVKITFLLTFILLKLLPAKAFTPCNEINSGVFFLIPANKCVDFSDKCAVSDRALVFVTGEIFLLTDTIPRKDSSLADEYLSETIHLLNIPVNTFRSLKNDSVGFRQLLPKKTALRKGITAADPLRSLKAAYVGLYEDQRKRFGQLIHPEAYFKEVERLKGIVNKDYLLNGIREMNSMTFKRPFQLQAFELSNTGQYAPLFPDTIRSYFINTFSVSSTMLLGGIPFAVSYQHQYNQMPAFDAMNRSLFSAKFDKTAYVNKLKSYIPDFDPKSLLPSTGNIWQTVKQKGELVLKQEIKAIETKFKGLLDTVTAFKQVENVFEKNVQTYVQEYLDPTYLQTITNATTAYTNYQQRITAGENIDTILFREVEKVVMRHKASQEVLAKITEHKRKWDDSGFGEKLKAEELLNVQKIQQVAKDPKAILKEAEKYVNLSQLQRLFLKFNKLNLGQSGVDMSPLTQQNYIGNGINGDLLTKRNMFFSFNGGRQKDMLSVFDKQFTNPLVNNESNSIGFRTGKGEIGKTFTHVSFYMYDQQQIANPGFTSSSPDRRTAVTTISSGFDLGAYGYVEAEVSRSSAGYKNSADPVDSMQQKVNPTEGLFNGNSIGESLAFSLNYKGEIEKFDLQHSIQISSTPNGYTNPGSTLLQRGQKKLAIDLKKYLLKRKLVLTLKANLKSFSFGTTDERKWIHSSYFVDARYKMKKGQSVSLRYQPNQFVQVTKGERQLYTKTERLAVDAVVGAKLFRKTYRNNFSLAYSNNAFALTAGSMASVKSLLLNTTQTLSFGKTALNVTGVYNYVNNTTDFVFFNSSLNCDAGISYTLLKHFSASSSIGYASTNGWYKQLSYKQGLSGNIHDRFDVSVYVDFRKNLKLYQPIYTGTTRAEFSLFYTIMR
jgi:hypothetical protein